jgi:hypothetical protein
MFIIRKIYINTVENLQRNNEHGNIVIDIECGIKIYVNHLHGPGQYFIKIQNIKEYSKNELFDICCCILNTIFEYYTPICIYKDEIETNDDTVYHMDRLELNKILFNEILNDIVIGDYYKDYDTDTLEFVQSITYIGHISKNNGMYEFTFDTPSEAERQNEIC